jgi:hypothetical protein
MNVEKFIEDNMELLDFEEKRELVLEHLMNIKEIKDSFNKLKSCLKHALPSGRFYTLRVPYNEKMHKYGVMAMDGMQLDDFRKEAIRAFRQGIDWGNINV